ncbi:unnamed protein product [Mytilus edulis]|uniref:ZMYM2-like/QRICH1 C-terminal domain-containing protein n=1 Tax=Mytilus edulis TaxID=6550 RepID=A0A8S3R6Q0_MYTED|nr:unnamed protein product [Mytilus edulis]
MKDVQSWKDHTWTGIERRTELERSYLARYRKTYRVGTIILAWSGIERRTELERSYLVRYRKTYRVGTIILGQVYKDVQRWNDHTWPGIEKDVQSWIDHTWSGIERDTEVERSYLVRYRETYRVGTIILGQNSEAADLLCSYGMTTKQADPILKEQEMILWEKEVVGYDSSSALLNGVFFYNCKLFGLRGRDEHHSFDASQINIGTDGKGKYIQFIETNRKMSRTRTLGITQNASSDKDLFKLYELYIGHSEISPEADPILKEQEMILWEKEVVGDKQKNVENKNIRHYTNASSDKDLFKLYELYIGHSEISPEADPILKEQEMILWEKEVVGYDSSSALLNGVFFYNCKLFGLRGRDEHHSFDASQINIGTDGKGKYIQFIETNSKTFKGGLKQKNVENKNIRHYTNASSDKNLFKLYELYIGHSEISPEGNSKFYKRPLQDSLRFSKQNLGINKLENLMKTTCTKDELSGNFTNHYGKRIFATTMFQSGLDEQTTCIMSQTGHRSVQGVRKYKRPSDDQLRDISNVLEPNCKSSKIKTENNSSDGKENEKCHIVELQSQRIKRDIKSNKSYNKIEQKDSKLKSSKKTYSRAKSVNDIFATPRDSKTNAWNNLFDMKGITLPTTKSNTDGREKAKSSTSDHLKVGYKYETQDIPEDLPKSSVSLNDEPLLGIRKQTIWDAIVESVEPLTKRQHNSMKQNVTISEVETPKVFGDHKNKFVVDNKEAFSVKHSNTLDLDRVVIGSSDNDKEIQYILHIRENGNIEMVPDLKSNVKDDDIFQTLPNVHNKISTTKEQGFVAKNKTFSSENNENVLKVTEKDTSKSKTEKVMPVKNKTIEQTEREIQREANRIMYKSRKGKVKKKKSIFTRLKPNIPNQKTGKSNIPQTPKLKKEILNKAQSFQKRTSSDCLSYNSCTVKQQSPNLSHKEIKPTKTQGRKLKQEQIYFNLRNADLESEWAE